jgi:uncharacterized protein DUF955
MNAGSRRPARKGFLPGNPKQWEHEHNGLDLRQDLGIEVTARLPVREAFDRLLPHVAVRPHGEIPCAQMFIDRFRGDLQITWSALALPLPDQTVQVIYNDSHSPRRRRATLMEEFFHLRLGHSPSKLRWYSDGSRRTFAPGIETQAYQSGAAALVPYKSLRELIQNSALLDQIADHFDVSTDLVLFRAKVTKLYRQLKQSAA